MRRLAAAPLLLLAAVAASAQDGQPPPPAEVDWGPKGGTLPPPAADRRNTPAKARAAALDWLVRHQGEDGTWSGEKFGERCDRVRCPGPGREVYSLGLTALAATALVRGGRLPGPEGDGTATAAALKALVASQDGEGCFGKRVLKHWVYNHAVATLALAEARTATGDGSLDVPLRRGLDFIRSAQNPYMGWRYGVRTGEDDTSVTGWMVQALRAGTRAGFAVEERHFQGALNVVAKLTEPEYGRTGYDARGGPPARPGEMMRSHPPAHSESMTAAGLLTRLLCGTDRKDEGVRKSADLCLRRLPEWDPKKGTVDLYYWYYGTEAFAWLGRDGWRKWSGALEEALLPWQRGGKDGCAAGSWDPVDPWQGDGGRVYATAMGALMAQRLTEKH